MTLIPASELHAYRGIQKSETGFIMGHEFVGTVVKAGSEVKEIKIGDKVVAPFTSSWYVTVSHILFLCIN
jgi:threonine dehydrogenase-like Zn-dependent dehydrogenase